MKDKLILGTAQFGLNYGVNNSLGKPSEMQVHDMLHLAYKGGVRVLDTADLYGNAIEVIGSYNRSFPGRFLINSKFKSNGQDLIASLEASLLTLGIESLEVYFYHSFSDFVESPQMAEQLRELKDKGKIKKIGLSVYENTELSTACQTDWIDAIQLPYNLLDNFNQRGELLSLAKESGKELHARSVFLQGLFFKEIHELPLKISPLKPYLERIRLIANELGTSIQQLAFSYVMQQKEIDYVIFGVDSSDQLRLNLNLLTTTIPKAVIDEINSIRVEEVKLLYPKNW